MKVLDGSLMFEEHITKWTQNTQKCTKQRETQVILRHSCKIAAACYFSRDIEKYTKNRPKILHDAHSRGIRALKFF